MKIRKLFTDLCYCPEEDLHIFCLLSEAALACFQLSGTELMGGGKGLAASHQLAPAKCQCWLDFSRAGRRQRKGGENKSKKKKKKFECAV